MTRRLTSLPDEGAHAIDDAVVLRARLHEVEQRIREVEERYALATSAALDGIYEWDLLSGRLLLTQRAAQFFALPADELEAFARAKHALRTALSAQERA